MKELFQKYKNILIGVVVIAVLGWGYNAFFAGKSGEALLSSGQLAQTGANNELVSTLLELQSLTLDERLFASPIFQEFVDFSRPILAEPVGRENPFAPIGVGGDPINRSPQTVSPSADTSSEEAPLDDSLDDLENINFDDLLF